MFHQPDLFSAPGPAPKRAASRDVGSAAAALDMPALIERIAAVSPRPRYTFMVLNLIARAAGPTGSAGPYVQDGERQVPVRDWLCDALVPMAQRDARRQAIVRQVRSELAGTDALPADPAVAEKLVEATVRERVRRSGRCNVSRAVSDLVRAGLLKRHYQGFRVDHHNRGAQREAVYTVAQDARRALGAA